jgi:NADH-quinone oxidoreductase subunit N
MTATVLLLIPEIALVAVAVAIYIAGAFGRSREVWSWIALGGIAAAATALALAPETGTGGPVEADALSFYVRWLVLGIGALLVVMTSRPLDTPGIPEYVGSLLLTIAGVMLAAGSGELILMFLGLELVSIPTYILLYLGRRDEPSQEAAAKYFYLSILASAMLLYGFSFLYGATGSTQLAEIGDRLLDAGNRGTGTVGFVRIALMLILAGLGFKIAAVPFHFYAPDVYQGTTHANAGLLSVVPKAAGLVALIRIVAVAMPSVGPDAWRVVAGLAVATMTLGNVMALWQQNLRRLLAYSSIAHAGYMLIGLSVYLATGSNTNVTWDGIAALLLYLLVYAVATVGTFAALSCLGRGPKQIESVEQLAGLAWTGGRIRPLLAWSLALFMFSLAGIPPLAGFWGKLALFASALGVEGEEPGVRTWFVALAVIGVTNAAVAAAYYLRVVGVMFFRFPLGVPRIKERSGGAIAVAALCGFLAIVIGLSPGIWIRDANRAAPAQFAGSPAGMPVALDGQEKSGRLPSLPLRWEATDSVPEELSH